VDISTFAPAVRDQIETARREVLASPSVADANGRLGMLYHVYRLDAQALTCYQRARILDASDPRWHYYPAVIALRTSRPEEAADGFRAAQKLAPRLTVLRLRLAEALAGAKRFDEATDAYKLVLTSGDALADAHVGLGRLLESRGKFDEALGHFSQACELSPGSKPARFAFAQLLRRQGKLAEAETQLSFHRSASDADPAPEDPFRRELIFLDISSSGFINRSVAYDKSGRVDLAIGELLNCLARHPGNINAQVNLISLYGRNGKYAEAEQFYRAVIAAKPAEPNAHFYWANTLAAQGRFADAAKAIALTLATNHEYPAAASLQGDLLAAIGSTVDAEASYRNALRVRPDDPVASLGLGLILARRGHSSEALPLLESGRLARGSASIRACQGLYDVYLKLGRKVQLPALLKQCMPVFALDASPAQKHWLEERLAQRTEK
jgi:tetratricopeptide (TPR) repeat protein